MLIIKIINESDHYKNSLIDGCSTLIEKYFRSFNDTNMFIYYLSFYYFPGKKYVPIIQISHLRTVPLSHIKHNNPNPIRLW